MNRILLSTVIWLMICGCNTPITEYREQHTERNNSSHGRFKKEVITIQTLKDIALSDYNTLQYNHGYFCFYNSLHDCVELIAHNRNSESKAITLESNQNYGSVNALCLYALDTIIIVQDYAITLYNQQGVCYKTVLLEATDSTQFFLGKFSDSYQPYYHNGVLYLQRYYLGCLDNRDCTDYSIEVAIHVFEERMDTLQILNSKLYKYNFDDITNVSRAVMGGQHLYSFQADPNIYSYSFSKRVVNVIGGKSIHQKIDPLVANKYAHDTIQSHRKKMELLVSMPQYTAITYNPKANRVYRLFFKELPYKNNEGRYNTFRDKECYLMEIDTNFTVLSETKLHGNYATNLLLNIEGKVGLLLDASANNFTIETYEKPY